MDSASEGLNLSPSSKSQGDRLRSQFTGLLIAYRECREKLDAALAQVAEMRPVLEELASYDTDESPCLASLAKEVLNKSDCGKGWVPIERVKPSARIIDLAKRLIAAGPKASHVSASECHEISEFIFSFQEESEHE